MPADNAMRVVAGARALSPFLGRRMMAGKLLRRSVVIRELTPQDLKLDIEHLVCNRGRVELRERATQHACELRGVIRVT